MILSSWASPATTAPKGELDTQSKDKNDETSGKAGEEIVDTFPVCEPEGSRVLGGFGPPRVCDLPGKLETSTMGGAPREDGPPRGGTWRITTAGHGCETLDDLL